ncbi:hypothetical protein GCM10028807_23550 [Spirosoma daeguense]
MSVVGNVDLIGEVLLVNGKSYSTLPSVLTNCILNEFPAGNVPEVEKGKETVAPAQTVPEILFVAIVATVGELVLIVNVVLEVPKTLSISP